MSCDQRSEASSTGNSLAVRREFLKFSAALGTGLVLAQQPLLADPAQPAEDSKMDRPAVDLTLIPPGPVTNQITLDVRGAVWNHDNTDSKYEFTFYVDAEVPENLLYRESVAVPAGSAACVRFGWDVRRYAGNRQVILVARSGGQIFRTTRAMEILDSNVRSTRRLGGAWIEFYHWSDKEGKLYNAQLAKMTTPQWRQLVRAMYQANQNLIVVQNMFWNDNHHHIGAAGYHGKAFYPSQLFPGRMPIACRDPLEAVLSEADLLGMQVMPGVGLYAWFDYSVASLNWHQQVASELWKRYGHHPSFYGWYVSEEQFGNLGDPAQRNSMGRFFGEFTSYVRKLAPNKPVMLATNSFGLQGAQAAYHKLLPNLDILATFGFQRMPKGDLTGSQAAALLQSLCDRAGTHFWLDLESFVFRNGNELYPRPVGQIAAVLDQLTGFEATLQYEFTGMMSSPAMSRQPGGPPSVRLYEGYQKYLRTLEEPSPPLLARPIRGTFLNLFYQDTRNKFTNPVGLDMNSPRLWQSMIREMSKVGIKYLIIMAVANEGNAGYESDFMPPAYKKGAESPVSAIMKVADAHGMRVFMSCGWAVNQSDNPGDPHTEATLLRIMGEVARKYGGHRSFYGWYLPYEDSIAPCFNDEAIRAVNNLAGPARRLVAHAKVMISPYGLSGAVLDDHFAMQLAKLNVDIVAYQDEVGCVRVPCPEMRAREQFAQLRLIHDQLPKIALWANVESFTWAGKPNSVNSALIPAPPARLLSQVAGVSHDVKETVSFIMQGMFALPDLPFPVGQPLWSARMTRAYLDFLHGKGRFPLLVASFRGRISNAATGKPVALATPSDHRYRDGNLTGGRLGAPCASADAGWLGFTHSGLEATIDLGAVMVIKTLAARFLQYSPAGILLPSMVTFGVSEDGMRFTSVAASGPEAWDDHLDCWIDMAIAERLSQRARYIRVHAVNAGTWLFVDQLFVNPEITVKVCG